MGEKENFSFRFDTDNKSKLEKLFNSKIYKTTTRKIEDSIVLLNNLYKCAEIELRNFFSIAEAEYMISIFKGIEVDYTKNSSIKDYLLDVYKIGRLNFNQKSNLNFNNLSEKINSVTDIQAFVIINKIVDYLDAEESDGPKSIFDLYIVDSNNVYSIDIVFDNTLGSSEEEIKAVIIDALYGDYIIDNNIVLQEVSVPFYDNISIAFRANNNLDITEKIQLKKTIENCISGICRIIDININYVVM